MDINNIFEAELIKREIAFKKIEDERYIIQKENESLTISIENIKDKNSSTVVSFVNNILQPISFKLPLWSQLKEEVYVSLEPSSMKLEDCIYHKLSDSTMAVIAFYSEKKNQIRYINKYNLKELGTSLYAVAPVRDFVYIFSKKSQLVNKVGKIVVEEYLNSPYPISTEVWDLSDNEIKAVGAYPVKIEEKIK